MSNLSRNPLVKGASGKFGDHFVYKTRGKRTSIAQLPKARKNAELTEQQTTIRDLFASAGLYAKGAISSPELKAAYQKKVNGQNTAYNIAFRDYLKAPKVLKIETEYYNGTVNSKIIITAKDDFRVSELKVVIRGAGGNIIEEGAAVQNSLSLEKWIYTATAANAQLAGSTISATAVDLPGNKGILDSTL